jgi:hypothetical protein
MKGRINTDFLQYGSRHASDVMQATNAGSFVFMKLLLPGRLQNGAIGVKARQFRKKMQFLVTGIQLNGKGLEHTLQRRSA